MISRYANNKEFINAIETFLKVKIKKFQTPPQGMDSEVFFIVDNKDKEYIIKASDSTMTDVRAYQLLASNKINIPVPKLLGNFDFEGKPIVILERITYPLLESIPVNQMHKYIPSMISNQRIMHKVKSPRSGYISDFNEKRSWKEFITSKFTNEYDSLNWPEVAMREGLEKDLVLESVNKILEKFNKLTLIDKDYSLIHTDFNQRNLFVNPKTNDIAGIIDWGEAMFGDPIYDFSRIRMYIWHFNLGNETVENYYKIMSYTPEERTLDDLYWLSRVIEYLAYYSEELNEFNIGRIKLHQNFLKAYKW